MDEATEEIVPSNPEGCTYSDQSARPAGSYRADSVWHGTPRDELGRHRDPRRVFGILHPSRAMVDYADCLWDPPRCGDGATRYPDRAMGCIVATMFTKQVSCPKDSLDRLSWPRRGSGSSELEERPAHGPNPSFCALHAGDLRGVSLRRRRGWVAEEPQIPVRVTSEEIASKHWESAYDFRRVVPIIARWLPADNS